MSKLGIRLAALERQHVERSRGPAAWIVMQHGETPEQARASYEAENGPLGDRYVIMWRPVMEAVCPA